MAEVTDNTDRHRFEMVVGSEVAFVTYTREDDRLVLLHTEVPQALAGRGIGTTLARAILDEIRRRQLPIEPRCEFMAAFIQRHPEFEDLVSKPPPSRT